MNRRLKIGVPGKNESLTRFSQQALRRRKLCGMNVIPTAFREILADLGLGPDFDGRRDSAGTYSLNASRGGERWRLFRLVPLDKFLSNALQRD
jgi:hypothetical protein